MQVIDPGHDYRLTVFDGVANQRLTFMKREGAGYPFNAGSNPGTNCQEVLRALIDRVSYLQRQIPCAENDAIVANLRAALYLFEIRAARRHGRELTGGYENIENVQPCATCGHIECGHTRQCEDFWKVTCP
jgi:hypothetical protein